MSFLWREIISKLKILRNLFTKQNWNYAKHFKEEKEKKSSIKTSVYTDYFQPGK